MRTRLAVLGAAAAFAGLAFAPAGSAAQMPWEKSLEAARSKSKATGRLMMVDLYTDW